ncbi:MAG: TatD family hydrolase [Candidatus Brocadiia bacterium]
MRIIDPHIHMFSRTTDDYKLMSAAGIEAVVEPAFWLGSTRTSPHTYFDYFTHILEIESARAAKYGIIHKSAIGVNAKEAENVSLSLETVAGMEKFLSHPNCVAVGEIGFNNITPNEEKVFRAQIDLAEKHKLPVVIHSPHFNKLKGIIRIVEILVEMKVDMNRYLVDHNTEETMPAVWGQPVWKGFTVYPTKMSPERTVEMIKKYGFEKMIVNSSADWGESDPLAVPKTVAVMRSLRFPKPMIQKVVFDNPSEFYRASGRFSVPE